MIDLGKLQNSGALRALDVEFARMMRRLDGRDDDVFALACAAASQAIAQGHSCLELSALGELLSTASSEPPEAVWPTAVALRHALQASSLVCRVDIDSAAPLVFDGANRLWLRRYFDYERKVASSLRARARLLREIGDLPGLRERMQQRFPPSRDTDWQAIAVALGLRSHLAVISGGPGTGKTTSVLWLLVALLESAEAQGRPLPRIRLAAPTGKAAARLGESIRERTAAIDCSDSVRAAIRADEASTLHRLLGFRPRVGFRHDRNHPVSADIVIVDEASMIDLPLMAHLLDALADDTALVLLGDVGQLASVEAGHVLASIGAGADEVNRYSGGTAADLAAMTGVSVPIDDSPRAALSDVFVELRQSHRFGEHSGIGRLAQEIRAGRDDAAIALLESRPLDVEWRRGDRDEIARMQRGSWVDRYRAIALAPTARDALSAANRFRILTAVREGVFGNKAINRAIEDALGGSAPWYHGRLVMVTANDYRRSLFNGDIGVSWREPNADPQVWFPGADGALRAFAPYALPAHEPAFAMTVHKSQGSEFDEIAVVLPGTTQRVLGRELLYTAVTRARSHVTLHADEGVLRAAIAQRLERWSGLPGFLRPP
ncbi:MAG: exodeoxyribonuclease V subunit alpha [Dokdonella sp.]|uniref:exodeoxyribonuclease V subunit alpha n=1 Tax=Dokdonella sp. TaxID=2291710 RepID=UPI003263A8A9